MATGDVAAREEELLTAGEVALLIKRSARTVSRLALEGRLPYAQRSAAGNGVYLFRRRDVLEYLMRDRNEQKPMRVRRAS